MVIYVHESGSDRQELKEELVKEGVTFKESSAETIRESGPGAGWRLVQIQANLPEVVPVPPQFAQSDSDVRVWRLPSGRMVIADMEGNLQRIATPSPSYGSR
jgi:hypothetical protein